MAASTRVALHISKLLADELKETSKKRAYPAAVIIKNAVLWYSQNPNALPSLAYPGNLEVSISVRLNDDLYKLVEEKRSSRTLSTYLRNALECYLPVLNSTGSNANEIRPSPPAAHSSNMADDSSNNKVKSLYDMNITGF